MTKKELMLMREMVIKLRTFTNPKDPNNTCIVFKPASFRFRTHAQDEQAQFFADQTRVYLESWVTPHLVDIVNSNVERLKLGKEFYL